MVDNRQLHEQEQNKREDAHRALLEQQRQQGLFEEREAARLLREQQPREAAAAMREQQLQRAADEERRRLALEQQRIEKEREQQRKRGEQEQSRRERELEQQRKREEQERLRRELQEQQRREKEQKQRQRLEAEAAASAVSKVRSTALGARLLREGLADAELARDNWAALAPLLSSPPGLVEASMERDGTKLTPAQRALTEHHATLALLQVTPSTSKGAELWCLLLARMLFAPSRRVTFCTPATRDSLIAVSGHAATADSCRWWSTAVNNLCASTPANKQLLGVSGIRDAFVALSRVAQSTPEGCRWWCGALYNLTVGTPQNQELFGTQALCDSVAAMSRSATTTEACQCWCGLLCSLTEHADEALEVRYAGRRFDNVALLGTVRVRDALFRCVNLCTNSQACLMWFTAYNRLRLHDVDDPQHPLYEALMSRSRYIDTADACQQLCLAFVESDLLHEELMESQLAYDVDSMSAPALRDAFLAVSRCATTADSCEKWCGALSGLVRSTPSNRPTLVTPAVIDALQSIKRYATTDTAMSEWEATDRDCREDLARIPRDYDDDGLNEGEGEGEEEQNEEEADEEQNDEDWYTDSDDYDEEEEDEDENDNNDDEHVSNSNGYRSLYGFDGGCCGFTAAECDELMMQNVKPWDDDAEAVLEALGMRGKRGRKQKKGGGGSKSQARRQEPKDDDDEDGGAGRHEETWRALD